MTLEPLASLDAARPGWDELAEAAANPFATWAWCSAWWERYGAGRELAIARVLDGDGRVAAILPLYRADRGPVARSFGVRFLVSPRYISC